MSLVKQSEDGNLKKLFNSGQYLDNFQAALFISSIQIY